MMKYKYILLLLLFTKVNSEILFTSYVRDTYSSKAVDNAIVFIANTGYYTRSDSTGFFKIYFDLKDCSDTLTFVASKKGFIADFKYFLKKDIIENSLDNLYYYEPNFHISDREPTGYGWDKKYILGKIKNKFVGEYVKEKIQVFNDFFPSSNVSTEIGSYKLPINKLTKDKIIKLAIFVEGYKSLNFDVNSNVFQNSDTLIINHFINPIHFNQITIYTNPDSANIYLNGSFIGVSPKIIKIGQGAYPPDRYIIETSKGLYFYKKKEININYQSKNILMIKLNNNAPVLFLNNYDQYAYRTNIPISFRIPEHNNVNKKLTKYFLQIEVNNKSRLWYKNLSDITSDESVISIPWRFDTINTYLDSISFIEGNIEIDIDDLKNAYDIDIFNYPIYIYLYPKILINDINNYKSQIKPFRLFYSPTLFTNNNVGIIVSECSSDKFTVPYLNSIIFGCYLKFRVLKHVGENRKYHTITSSIFIKKYINKKDLSSFGLNIVGKIGNELNNSILNVGYLLGIEYEYYTISSYGADQFGFELFSGPTFYLFKNFAMININGIYKPLHVNLDDRINSIPKYRHFFGFGLSASIPIKRYEFVLKYNKMYKNNSSFKNIFILFSFEI